jgi:hypothetical protein
MDHATQFETSPAAAPIVLPHWEFEQNIYRLLYSG